MSHLFPFRFERFGAEEFLVTTEAGDFFFTTAATLDRMVLGKSTQLELSFLLKSGFAYEYPGDFYYNSFLRRMAQRKFVAPQFSYFILVPTLRCDLTCSYCQVSRAHLDANAFDWSSETLKLWLTFLDATETDHAKVEFQGGEPTLRLDIIEEIIRHCEGRDIDFVICSNLSAVDSRLLRLLERNNVTVSTSLDGPPDIHRKNRTGSVAQTSAVLANIRAVRAAVGPDKVAALTTIPARDYARLPEIVDTYLALEFESIYLRPVSFHGFARKRQDQSEADADLWNVTYQRALDHIFDRNWTGYGPLRETSLEVMLRRIFRRDQNGHVDLRTPNPVARDYLVIDYDGRFYPSDEARMLARIGHADLSVGSLWTGLDRHRIAEINWNQLNELDPDCIHCPYQPYCGIDTIDDIARYNRIDICRYRTWFCKTHFAAYTAVFERLRHLNPIDQFNLSGHMTGTFDLPPFFGPSTYDPPRLAH